MADEYGLETDAIIVTTSREYHGSVAASLVPTKFMPVNGQRRMATVYNDSTNKLYLKLGSGVSTESFTVIIPPKFYYEFPTPVYSGVIEGMWDGTNGAARIAEFE